MKMRSSYWIIELMLAAFVLGVASAFFKVDDHKDKIRASYQSGYYSKSFYDRAYDSAPSTSVSNASAILTAHHLLVADSIAQVFATIATDDPVTLVIVGPNHFSRGPYEVQTTIGTWATPYGDVVTDDEAIAKLQKVLPELQIASRPFEKEHGIYGLIPFVRRSLPSAKIVPIILDQSVLAQTSSEIGETIARVLPNAIFVASIDMTHNQPSDITQANDQKVLALLEDPVACAPVYCETDAKIDSTASLQTLLAFVKARKATVWHLTHYGSSLEMGATDDSQENVSHILGAFASD